MKKSGKGTDPPKSQEIVNVNVSGYGWYTGYFNHSEGKWRVKVLDGITDPIPEGAVVTEWKEI